MRAQLSWLQELVPQLGHMSAFEVADLLTSAGVEVDEILGMGPDDINGITIGEVEQIQQLSEFKKPIRYCQVRVADGEETQAVRGIVCGAENFAVGDKVAVALPGAVLPGNFQISARTTYGHTSDGMICSAHEMGLGDDASGIMILPDDAPVGADGVDYLGLHETVLVTEPTPDRGYQLSMRGLARDLAAKLGVPFVDPADPAQIEVAPAGAGFPVVLEDAACDEFCAQTMAGFDPAATTPQWIRRRIIASGMRPISLAVDISNYVMLLLGGPIHFYDRAKLDGQLRVRRAVPGERFRTLDDVERTLSGADLLITDGPTIQGLAGVMGGEAAEIRADTTSIVIEAAHFDPATTSRSVRSHHLLTEAGRRFERGVDIALPPIAASLAAALLTQYGRASLDGPMTVVGAPSPPRVQRISIARLNALLGKEYGNELIASTLKSIGALVRIDGDELELTPPSWRPDLVEMPDFAEEVARIDGYDNIPVTLPAARAGRGLTFAQRSRRAVSRSLAYSGFVETPSLSFHDDAVLDRLRIEQTDQRRRLVYMANPLSSEQTALRSTLLPALLATVVRNIGRGFDDVAIYELGTVFTEPDQPRPPAPMIDTAILPTPQQFIELARSQPIERLHVAVAITGAARVASWMEPARPAGWQDALAAARTIADAVDVSITVTQAQLSPWHPGRCAEVCTEAGDLVGYAGELHPAICEELGLPRNTGAVELDLGVLFNAAQHVLSAPSVSTFPAARQDLALVVPTDTTAAAIERTIVAYAGPLLESVRLFDLYTGAQVGAGKKSLAYALTFRASDRTLKTEEVNTAREAILDGLASDLGAVLR